MSSVGGAAAAKATSISIGKFKTWRNGDARRAMSMFIRQSTPFWIISWL
jgi:hypothetical protein